MSNLGLFNGPGGPFYDQNQLRTKDTLDNSMTEANINSVIQRNQQAQAMNPLLLQQQQNQNAESQAKLPGIIGQSQSLAAEGQTASETQPDKSKAVREQIMANMSDSKLKQMDDIGEMFGRMGATLKQLPSSPATSQVFQGMLSKLGVDPNEPTMAALSKLSPDQLPDALTKISQGMAETSAKYIQQKGVAGIAAQSRTDVANIKAKSAEQIAQEKIDAQNQWKTLDNNTKLQIASEGNKLKQWLLENKAINTDQLVAKRQQAFDNDPSEDNKAKLKEASDMKAFLNSSNGHLIDSYAKGELTQNVLGNQLAPNTVPKPVNPADTFKAQQPSSGVIPPVANPGAPIIPTAPEAPTAQDTATVLDQYRKKYPGKTDVEIKAAYKKITGKDL